MNDAANDMAGEWLPLVTDLDGTLIQEDILFIGIGKLLKKNVLYLFYCVAWLAKGRVHLKEKVLKIVNINPQQLKYNVEVLDFLKKEFAKGRKIILATATVKPVAIDIAAHCGIFSDVYGTENDVNLKGKKKLGKLILQFGEKGFDYIGDASADLVVFKHCRYAYLVKPSRWLEKNTRKIATVKNIWY